MTFRIDRYPSFLLSRRMVKRVIEPGQRYRDVSLSVFGRSVNSKWIVEAVEADGLGVRHARIVKMTDLTERKTLAVCALADPSRFEEF